MSKKSVEKAYNKLTIWAHKHSKLQQDFDNECKKEYGFIFQDCNFSIHPEAIGRIFADEDSIIDTIDYGTDSLPFKEFDNFVLDCVVLMNNTAIIATISAKILIKIYANILIRL